MPARDELTLTVGGVVYGGWKEVRVTRGAERLPSDFHVLASEKYPNGRAVALASGQEVEVRIGADPVITGYIDRDAQRLAAGDHAVIVAGRSRTQDLVDASAEIEGWGGQRLEAPFLPLAKELCAPHGIGVADLSRGGADQKFESFTVNLGESAYDIIERVARSLQLMAYDDALGNLVLARNGGGDGAEVRDGLAEGVNVQSAVVGHSMDGRFSEYRVVPQSVEAMRDRDADLGAPPNRGVSAFDKGVARHRRLFIVYDQSQRGESLAQKRADWELNRRWGRSQTAKVVCDSWRDAKGRLWEPNTLVSLHLPSLGLAKRAWLLAEVTFNRDGDSGTTAELTLMPREAFSVQPVALASMDWDKREEIAQSADAPLPGERR